MEALPRPRVTYVDVAIGLALTAFGVLITISPPEGPEGLWLGSVVIPAATLPVIWRRRAPWSPRPRSPSASW